MTNNSFCDRGSGRIYMNERTLSSAQTFLMKFIFPTFWIFIFGMATLEMFLGNLHGKNGKVSPDFMKWEFLGAWIAGSIFIYFACGRLKKVRTAGSALFVSNFFKEVQIPLDAVREVTQNRWINIHPVTIHFREATPFGDRITFMPPRRLFNWGTHPVVNELRDLCGLPKN